MNLSINENTMGTVIPRSMWQDVQAHQDKLKKKERKKRKRIAKKRKQIAVKASQTKQVKALKKKLTETARQNAKVLMIVGGAGLAGILLIALLKK